MRHLYHTFRNKLKNGGLRQSVASTFRWFFCSCFPQDWIPRLIRRRHALISRKIDRELSSTVRYGPFRGLKLSPDSSWSLDDRAAMLFGLYESEVLEELQDCSKTNRLFIDLGAADGYYGVGVLSSNLFPSSFCFEISPDGQKAILENARINGVSERITVMGIADKDFHKNFTEEQLASCVILVDIEGAEFDLFDEDVFQDFAKATIIIELHEQFVDHGAEKLERLKHAGSRTHRIKEIVTGARDLSKFPEVKDFSDYDRWLICSERRRYLQTWLRFDPIQRHFKDN